MADTLPELFPYPPPGCDAMEFGASPTVFEGGCRCVVCGRCGHHTGNANQGHYWSWCKVTGTMRGFHFCCPDDEFGCALEHGDDKYGIWMKTEPTGGIW